MLSNRWRPVRIKPVLAKKIFGMQFIDSQARKIMVYRVIALVLLWSISAPASAVIVRAQDDQTAARIADDKRTEETNGFRVEKVAVAGGSELITILARRSYLDGEMQGPISDIPLVSVLRDTLGDNKPENDRLRYVWMLTHTDPSFGQKLSALVPFLYSRTVNKANIRKESPPPILDLNAPNPAAYWNQAFWSIFKRLILSDIGVGIKASTLQYHQNKVDYRRTGIAAAAAVLSLYQELEGEKVFSDRELMDIQARLFLTDKPLGWRMQLENLERVYRKETFQTRDYRGHNWELLRQYSEAQGLYFDPLEMPDGTTRHAMVWVAAADLQSNKGKKFEKRFLNFASPWNDERLMNWKGYSEVRWYDKEDREVPAETPDAHPKTLIPLALYGLDHPKVPAILIDFRNNVNPKMREMSRRILNDLTGNVLSLSRFGGTPLFLGRFVYDFVTGRRGADINQASRLRSYAQLKLFLALNDSLDRGLSSEVSARIESATLNPLQNDAEVEARIAKAQYENLLAYANDPKGLPRKIDEDRREEMSRIKHSGKSRALFALASFLTFGRYRHREEYSPELLGALDNRRQLDFHERFLREVAFNSSDPEIDNRPDDVKQSLRFVAQNGTSASEKTTKALARIFAISKDEDIQTLSLQGLYRINNTAAKKELLAIYENERIEPRWRRTSARFLRLALDEGQRISSRDARMIAGIAAADHTEGNSN